MLVLSRKKFESVWVSLTRDDVIKWLATNENSINIDVQVSEIQGDKARLGFTAPRWVHVLRTELVDKPDPVPQSEST